MTSVGLSLFNYTCLFCQMKIRSRAFCAGYHRRGYSRHACQLHESFHLGVRFAESKIRISGKSTEIWIPSNINVVYLRQNPLEATQRCATEEICRPVWNPNVECFRLQELLTVSSPVLTTYAYRLIQH